MDISFLLPNKEHTLNVGVEHRIANADTLYKNGAYFNKEEGLLQNLPQQSYVEVPMRALGRDNLKSEWTTPIVVHVLESNRCHPVLEKRIPNFCTIKDSGFFYKILRDCFEMIHITF